jgi:hypothetical protein
MGVLLVLAIAMLSVPVMAQGISGSGGVDILGTNGGIFETDGSAFRFPELTDTNVDTLTVGNDRALAFGGFWHRGPMAVATNNLEIKKNQDSGACDCCTSGEAGKSSCQDCCIKVNVEQVTVGNRNALAFGSAAAVNNVKLVLNQQ